ncbi:MAG: TonB-dependent receptor [Melioribacteraceae bacterium]
MKTIKDFRKIFLLSLIMICLFPAISPSQIKDTSDVWEMDLETLQKIKISAASLILQYPSEAPSSVSVITAEEIKNMGASNLEEILRGIVGFDIISKPFQPLPYIGIRGLFSTGSNNKIKIMLDGHTLQTFVGDLFFHTNTLPIENIKQIEIIRGPGSAIYGSNAFIGVINIITKDDFPNEINAYGGTYNTFGTSLSYNYEKDDFKGRIFAGLNKTEGPSLFVESDLASLRFGEKYSAAPGYTTEFSRNLTLQSSIVYKELFFDGFFQALKTQSAIGANYSLTDEDQIRSCIGYGKLGYRFEFSNNSKVQVTTYYDNAIHNSKYELLSEQTTKYFSELFPATPYQKDEGVEIIVKSKNYVYGGELITENKLTPFLNLIGGFSADYYVQTDIHNYSNANTTAASLTLDGNVYLPFQNFGSMRDMTSIAIWNRNTTRTVTAFFGQILLDMKNAFSLSTIDGLSVTIGARHDTYSDIGSTFNPRIGLVFSPTNKFHFKILYGKSFRAPFFHELFQTGSVVTFGNTDLRPENIYTSEFLIGYSPSLNIHVDLSYFNTQVKDLILRDANSKYNNFGKVEASGFELDFKYKLNYSDYFYINSTFQNVVNTTNETIYNSSGTSYKKSDFSPGGISAFVFNFGLNYLIIEQINFNISMNYVGPKKRSDEKTIDNSGNIYSKDKRNNIPAHSLVSCSVIFKDLFSFMNGLDLQLTGYNLMNTKYYDPESTGQIPNDIPRAGRHFIAKISYSF